MECDVAVLGGGPGGYTAAIRAANAAGSLAVTAAGARGGMPHRDALLEMIGHS